MLALKITQIGNSLGVVLPKEILTKLNVVKGDSVFFTNAADGMRLTANDPSFADQMAAARSIMKKRRHVLHELAK